MIKLDRHREFLKAYESYPSQDNEGYVPDRGGFKAGFGAAWDLLQAELEVQSKLAAHYLKLLDEAGDERDRLEKRVERLERVADAVREYNREMDENGGAGPGGLYASLDALGEG